MGQHCKGCIHWRSLSGGGEFNHACHFALDNHACRLVPAENCPYKITETEKEEMSLIKINEAEARKLYDAGKNDSEIAEAIGASVNAVFRWRSLRGLRRAPGKKHQKQEDRPVALPEEVREKVKATAGDQGVVIDMARMNHHAEQRIEPAGRQKDPGPEEMNEYGDELTRPPEPPVFPDPDAEIAGIPGGADDLPEPETDRKPGIPAPAQTDDNALDPLVYDAFDFAIAKIYARGGQPSMIWRQLLRASEEYMERLRDYLCISEETCRCTVELAALAALAAVEEQGP